LQDVISRVAPKRPQRIVGLVDLLRREHPELDEPEEAVREGAVLVDGVVAHNVRSRVRRDAVIQIDRPKTLRGAKKLTAALDAFGISVTDRVALDLGASSGGFTSVLLDRGAAVVFAVDVGYGQLLGSLRQNPRVRSLERTNLADLTADMLGSVIDIVTMDLSYLSIADAIGQIERVEFAPAADLVALVKPMFELGLGALPSAEEDFQTAIDRAVAGVERQPWTVEGVIRSPASGGRGAVEYLLHATRSA
jgi:23S rRNA (cytidine1920-2'-O)/16S rRNA (cytidine1409-2'-O)-methyltransferase